MRGAGGTLALRGACALLALTAAFPLRADPAEEADRWIARADDALAPAGAQLLRVRLWIRDADGVEEELELDWARKRDASGRRSVFEFREPAHLAGTAQWLRWRPGGGIERDVWTPETGRLIRTRGLRPDDPVLGSLFALEELGLVPPRPHVWRDVRREEEAVLVRVAPFHLFSGGLARLAPDTGRWLALELRDRAGQDFRQVRFGPAVERAGLAWPEWIHVEDRLSRAASRLSVLDQRPAPELRDGLFDPRSRRERLRRGRGFDVPGPGSAGASSQAAETSPPPDGG